MKIKNRYETICNEYIALFVKKHGREFSWWIADEIGGTACFIDQYFFTMTDIIYDINNKVSKGVIFEWQDYNLEFNFDSINLLEFSKGNRL